MATSGETSQPQEDDQKRPPKTLSADEHGQIELAFRDSRVADDDAFEMPDQSD